MIFGGKKCTEHDKCFDFLYKSYPKLFIIPEEFSEVIINVPSLHVKFLTFFLPILTKC